MRALFITIEEMFDTSRLEWSEDRRCIARRGVERNQRTDEDRQNRTWRAPDERYQESAERV